MKRNTSGNMNAKSGGIHLIEFRKQVDRQGATGQFDEIPRKPIAQIHQIISNNHHHAESVSEESKSFALEGTRQIGLVCQAIRLTERRVLKQKDPLICVLFLFAVLIFLDIIFTIVPMEFSVLVLPSL